MSSVQDIQRRVRSVSNTRKITRALELVAGAKLRRAQARIEAVRPYADRMEELMIGTARASTSLRGLPLLQRREVRRVAIVPLTGDRGLAGPFNAQIMRRAFASEREYRRQGVEVRWLVAGKKGLSTLRFRGYQVDGSWTGFADQPRILRRAGHLPPRRPDLHRRRGRPRRDRLQPVRVAARPAGRRAGAAACARGGAAGRGRASGRRSAATSSTSRSPSRSSSACCPPTSRRRSTARCSSRRRRTRARR